MVEYVSFHGTESSVAEEKIKYKQKNIIVTTFNREMAKGRSNKKVKAPGNLGYGFYTFIKPENIVDNFMQKITNDYKVIKVISCFEDEEVLDLDNDDTRAKFHRFRNSFIKRAKSFYDILGKPNNNANQHSMDGIVLECFIMEIFNREKQSIKAVKMWTNTPLEKDRILNSFISNGLELCIRDKKNIYSLVEREI